jgi:hypothetical protein
VGRGGDRFWAGDVRELYLSGERPIRLESVPTGSGVGGLCDRGGGSCPCGGNKGSVLLVFATGLYDGPENIGGVAGRGDQIESAVVKSVKILVPIRET